MAELLNVNLINPDFGSKKGLSDGDKAQCAKLKELFDAGNMTEFCRLTEQQHYCVQSLELMYACLRKNTDAAHYLLDHGFLLDFTEEREEGDALRRIRWSNELMLRCIDCGEALDFLMDNGIQPTKAVLEAAALRINEDEAGREAAEQNFLELLDRYDVQAAARLDGIVLRQLFIYASTETCVEFLFNSDHEAIWHRYCRCDSADAPDAFKWADGDSEDYDSTWSLAEITARFRKADNGLISVLCGW